MCLRERERGGEEVKVVREREREIEIICVVSNRKRVGMMTLNHHLLNIIDHYARTTLAVNGYNLLVKACVCASNKRERENFLLHVCIVIRPSNC